MSCDLCGKNLVIYSVMVEGSRLNVCENCARFGKVLERIRMPQIGEKKKVVFEKKPEISESIIPDYNLKIKTAREKRKMTQEELAKAIAEKESVIHKIESKTLEPELSLIRKLEHFFKIKLIAKDDLDIVDRKKEIKKDVLTIGDLLSK